MAQRPPVKRRYGGSIPLCSARLKEDDMGEKFMIILEGNIGAGKSTLGKELEKSGHYAFIPEPIQQWQKGFSQNLLDLFYKDQKRWAFTFQWAAFTTRAKTWDEILAKTEHNHIMLERSIYSDRYVFAKNCHETGVMNDSEWEIYCKMWDWLQAKWCIEPDLIIYLRTPAEICRQRIIERDRIAERNAIPLEYLQKLEAVHDKWLFDNPSVLLLDGIEEWTAREVKNLIEYRGTDGRPGVAYCP